MTSTRQLRFPTEVLIQRLLVTIALMVVLGIVLLTIGAAPDSWTDIGWIYRDYVARQWRENTLLVPALLVTIATAIVTVSVNLWLHVTAALAKARGEHPIREVAPINEVQFAKRAKQQLDLAIQKQPFSMRQVIDALFALPIDHGASELILEPEAHPHPMMVTVSLRMAMDLIPLTAIPTQRYADVVQALRDTLGLNGDDGGDGNGHVSFRSEETVDELQIILDTTDNGVRTRIQVIGRIGALLTLSELGLFETQFQQLNTALRHQTGLLIATGPQAQGVNTTLYAIAHELSKQRRGPLIAFEKTVESDLPFMHQIELPDGPTPTVFKRILRRNPAVLIWMEADLSMASAAEFQLALTAAQNRLVLLGLDQDAVAPALLHLCRRASTIDPPLALSSILRLAIAQRTARRACRHCATTTTLPDKLRQLIPSDLPDARWIATPGCASCHNTGWNGLIPIYEMVEASPQITTLLSSAVNEATLSVGLRKLGIASVTRTAIELAAKGKISVAELERIHAA